jgi:hypothetical protein
MQVICLEEAAFYALVEQVVARLGEKNNQPLNKWIDDEEAMRLLGIKSKTTLQALRDEGKIRYTQPQKKIILYDRTSVEDYLEKYVRQPFSR